jgi:hypothetical protein
MKSPHINIGIPELSIFVSALATATLGFDPVKTLDEVFKPALRAPIFLKPVGKQSYRWYPLAIPEGRTYTRTILNGQAEVGIGVKDGRILLLLPRAIDVLMRGRFTAEGPLHGVGPAGSPASIWAIAATPGKLVSIPLPADITLHLEFV